MRQKLILFLKGFLIGTFILLPGVSGGLICIFLGVYEDIIDRVSNLFKNFKKNIIYLIPLTIGGLSGMALCSKMIRYIYLEHYNLFFFFTIGILLGSIFFIKQGDKGFKCRDILGILIGFLSLFLIYQLPPYSFENKNLFNYIYFLLIGVLIAIGLILPGISVSHMLLILGLYEMTLNSIAHFNLSFLGFLFTSVLLGILLTLKFLNYGIEKHRRFFYNLVCGFILGSVLQTLFFEEPIYFKSGGQMILSGLLFLLGLLFIIGISLYKKKHSSEEK